MITKRQMQELPHAFRDDLKDLMSLENVPKML